MALVGIAAVLLACGSVKDRGELMVAMQTDLDLPHDIDHVNIQVTSYGKVLWTQDYSVDPTTGGVKIPATLGVVGDPTNPAAPVEITITAEKESSSTAGAKTGSHVLRDVTTTVPADRTALLRMPIEWLCWNTGVDPTSGSTTCPSGQTCVAGSCTGSTINSDDLKPFDPTEVFGGSSDATAGACFDTIGCFAQGAGAPVDFTDCSIPAPANTGAGINVALLRNNPSGSVQTDATGKVFGVCNTTSTCYVPLDEDPTEGWTLSGNKILLPSAVCTHLTTATPPPTSNPILAVDVTTACATKTAENPTCGAWSSVGSSADNGTTTHSSDGGIGNQASCLIGTWGQDQGGTACDGESGNDSVQIASDGNGGYLVTMSDGPFASSDGSCQMIEDDGVPATVNADGSLTFSPSLSQVCTCSSADVSITLAVSTDCSTLTATQTFSGVAECPQSASTAVDAGTPDATVEVDSGSGGGGSGGSSSGGTSSEDAGTSSGNFCSSCGDVTCTVTTTFMHHGGSVGSDGGTAPFDSGATLGCNGQSCSPGFTCCENGCVDEQNDPGNCGGCGHVCPEGCQNAQCAATGSDSGVQANCTPQSAAAACASLQAELQSQGEAPGTLCGPAADGCGGTVQCGSCTGGETCGGGSGGEEGGVSPLSECGTGGKCVPLTQCPASATCGPWPDGCGSTITCGGCTIGGQTCGGGGTPSQCGGP